ncbi:uncharacterized protein BO97DRAFT_443570 [Aspergillus homomorphus CBS 101889]|uniref:AsqO/PenF-like C-terminal domain-containing protein n=1 Tax=Aspergillus homomorphus (strain CBS 101889) TaxID=1450537 RepID=A0A395HV97_ASPHC|nr:hypothetical protein BO97DRAFT_443570 [Aspergillus homomorphus CBS 101889]RAL11862.1 hypothetical protein BO97DRAFT_443570 [Aspergillus homomorphus CBS 101889]
MCPLPLPLLLLIIPIVRTQYISPIPSHPASTEISAIYHAPNSWLSELSAPKISAVNTSAFEWWYFDAISATNPNVSAAFTFFTASPSAFPLAPRNASSIVWSVGFVSLPSLSGSPGEPGEGSGDEDSATHRARQSGSEGRVVSEIGVSGEVEGEGEGVVLGDGRGWNVGFWEGLGGWVASFPSPPGSPLGQGMGKSRVKPAALFSGQQHGAPASTARYAHRAAASAPSGTNIDVWVGWEGSRISGRLRLENATSPRTACSTTSRFDPSLRLGPIGWANIVPHAKASVDLVVDGEVLGFEGYGYHDKNWSERPFHTQIRKWFWGHAHVGPYSVVWFQATPQNGTVPFGSASILKDGVPVLGGCEAGIVSVQRLGSPASPGFGVEVVMRGVRLVVSGTREVAGDGVRFFRWAGLVQGVILGDDVGGGVALFEEFEL